VEAGRATASHRPISSPRPWFRLRRVGSLEDDLEGFYRLRVSHHRIIFRYATDGAIDCIHAAPRAFVYDVFSFRLRDFIDPRD
jgi:mRNA-degrading endonuclease RelE of RelBE toxin-antitoxin system